jgi:hypothetical protein
MYSRPSPTCDSTPKGEGDGDGEISTHEQIACNFTSTYNRIFFNCYQILVTLQKKIWDVIHLFH